MKKAKLTIKKLKLSFKEMADVLTSLGYRKVGNSFYRSTLRGRIHIMLESGHYTLYYDSTPHRAWKEIEKIIKSKKV